ncbi:retinitis pigmentosa 9 protein-like isoform X3 [Rousettus aegyptiacus]|uniref:retinitis pigmentosa 9 protein-like isoform X3 n=1 Tax=Rousettus aegyptiacus TaxID=9407 RepID=UPI00168CB5AD|nr:retinitis pigmentosa 9 protein-like isoform X3 [Rousettus aegyptiacus]
MSSRSGRDDAGAGAARRAREPPEQELQRRREQKRRRQDAQQLQQLKHLESFYEKPPPGLIKEDETKPEDCIPDVPGNEHAREFLAHAPTKGLWMPLGKEVKVMQCWRCKRYGHRTGDKECPFFIKGNQKLEQFRVSHFPEVLIPHSVPAAKWNMLPCRRMKIPCMTSYARIRDMRRTSGYSS